MSLCISCDSEARQEKCGKCQKDGCRTCLHNWTCTNCHHVNGDFFCDKDIGKTEEEHICVFCNTMYCWNCGSYCWICGIILCKCEQQLLKNCNVCSGPLDENDYAD